MRFDLPEQLFIDGILIILVFQMNKVETTGVSIVRFDC
jgi:hypothetical protein